MEDILYTVSEVAKSVEEVILETLNQRKDFTDELFKECEI